MVSQVSPQFHFHRMFQIIVGIVQNLKEREEEERVQVLEAIIYKIKANNVYSFKLRTNLCLLYEAYRIDLRVPLYQLCINGALVANVCSRFDTFAGGLLVKVPFLMLLINDKTSLVLSVLKNNLSLAIFSSSLSMLSILIPRVFSMNWRISSHEYILTTDAKGKAAFPE